MDPKVFYLLDFLLLEGRKMRVFRIHVECSLEEDIAVEGADFLDRLGVGVAGGDTAHVDTTLDVEEAFVTPGSIPRVLDDPVVFAS